jgi:hypothetical protein
VGSEEVATVPLHCRDPYQLNALACQPDLTSVTAVLKDLTTGLEVPTGQAENLSVSAGEPREQNISDTETEWVLNPKDTHALSFVGALPTPYWVGEEIPSFAEWACVLALDLLPPQAVTSVSCQSVETLDLDPPVALSGMLLPHTILDDVLMAAGFGETFPDEGLVVGRVVSDKGAPVADVSVNGTDTENATNATIEYIAEDWLSTGSSKTTSNGFFISRDAVWGSVWTAVHTSPTDDRTHDGLYVGGLIVGKVTVLLIRLTPPPE